MLLLIISFIGGALTVLAPCILPLLPVIVGGSLSGDTKEGFNKKKALTIIISLGVSVIAFTFLLKVSTVFIDIPEYTWKLISGGIVILLGIVTLFPALWETRMLAKISAKSNTLMGTGFKKKSLWGDVIIGASLGPIFSTCSPTYVIILATVLPVSISAGIVYLLTYTIGLCLALLVVSIVGQKIMDRLGVVADPKGWFKKTLGIIFIIVGIAIIGGIDKKVELFILESGFFDVTKIEQKLLDANNATIDSGSKIQNSTSNGSPTLDQTSSSTDKAQSNQTSRDPIQGNVQDAKSAPTKSTSTYLSSSQKQARFNKAPELVSPSGFINTDGKPITLASLKGKVVLLDIWTYSCINCQRTLPYVNNWYGKYKDQGFEIIGLHAPEFSFEKIQANVQKAVDRFGIKYPVVLDNDYATWRALHNNVWPRKYLIDIDGYIVYDHSGEGQYDLTEKAIQEALKERASRMGIESKITDTVSNPSNAVVVESGKVRSPEIYFGSARNEYLSNGESGRTGEQKMILPSLPLSNGLYLGGTWNITPEYAENSSAGDILFKYDAKNVYMASGSTAGVDIEIFKDDILIKKITIKDEKLYQLIEGSEYVPHTLRIKIGGAGLKAFTFTFG